MGKRGPAPYPTNLKIITGARKDRINRGEPQPRQDGVSCPEWLDGEARDVWDRYADDLERTGVLTPWDVDAFAHLCDAVTRRRRAVMHLRTEGEIVEAPVFNKNGEVTGHRRAKNPWCLVLDAADGQILRWGSRFGLTPSDRAQLNIPTKTVDLDNPFAASEAS